MNKLYNAKLIPNAKNLRKNMTEEERRLWFTFLRFFPQKFVRQKVIGPYIADFYCAEASLAIELDGAQHFDEEQMQYDAKRTAFFEGQGVRVARYTNREINEEFESVKADIALRLGKE